MRRFLLILLAVLMPMKFALATVVTVTGPSSAGCVQMRVAHQHLTTTMNTMAASDCGCMAAGTTSGSMHGQHACPHLGMAVVAISCSAEPPTIPSFNAAPDTAPAAFDSIVLGVPSPPPTFLV